MISGPNDFYTKYSYLLIMFFFNTLQTDNVLLGNVTLRLECQKRNVYTISKQQWPITNSCTFIFTKKLVSKHKSAKL